MYSFKWFLLCQITNIQMNIKRGGIWANLCRVYPSNWKTSLRMKWTLTTVGGKFRTKWMMVWRSSIQKTPALYWIQLSIQSKQIWTLVSWWTSQAVECPFYLPINRWPCSRLQIFNSRTTFLPHQVWAIWFIMTRWGWDADLPGALVADEMGYGKTFARMAAAMPCKLVTENVVMELPLSILWGITLQEYVILAHNNFPGIVSEEREWYLLQRL